MNNIIALSMAAAAYCSLSSSLNLPRPGDSLTLNEIQLAGELPDTAEVYDFTEALIGREVKREFFNYPQEEGCVCEVTNPVTKFYRLADDGVMAVVEERKPGMRLIAVDAEEAYAMPEVAGGSRDGYFASIVILGNGGGNRVCELGRTRSRIQSGLCRIVIPSGDTIRDVIHRIYEKSGAMSQQIPISADSVQSLSAFVCRDSIDRYLSTDSIIHRRSVHSWYAPGYRYPIVEHTRDILLLYGEKINDRSRTLFYEPSIQAFEITDDADNQDVREAAYFAGNTSTGDMTGKRGPQSAKNGQGDSEETVAGVGADLIVTANSCDVRPTIVSESTTVSLALNRDSDIQIALYSEAGVLMWKWSERCLSGLHSVECRMSGYASGNYLLRVNDGNGTWSYKLVKP